MKRVAIHFDYDDNNFCHHWMKILDDLNINYKLVDCFDNNIINELDSIDILLFNWLHYDYSVSIFAANLIYTIQSNMGVKVYPSFDTCFHYDNKVDQKYIFESLDIPHIPTYVFYDKNKALTWSESITYPKVFKLRGGAGSSNVKLINSISEARKIINKSFGYGHPVISRTSLFRDRLYDFKKNKNMVSLVGILKGLARLFVKTTQEVKAPRDKSYIYFQDFVKDNNHDIRVIVIDKKAFAIKRNCRDGDFRASGSGNIIYDRHMIPLSCVKLAFIAAKKLKSQCVAFDFVFNEQNEPLVVEISYMFTGDAYFKCSGYWDENLNFYNEKINPYKLIVDSIII